MSELIDKLEAIIADAERERDALARTNPKARMVSIAITQMETARLWLSEADR